MTRKLLQYISLLLILLAGGCSSDEPFLAPGGGEASLNLLVPSVELARSTGQTHGADIATRAHSSAASLKEAEGKMNDLYVIGFRTDAGKRSHFYAALTPDMGTNVDGVYRSFSFDVAPGEYNVYVLANLDPSGIANLDKSNLSEDAEKTLENAVKGLDAKFNTALPSPDAGLPMAGKKEGVKVTKGTRTDVKADLSFLCAKVRLTVIREASAGIKGGAVSALQAKDVYSPVPAFKAVESASRYDFPSPAALSGHYELGETAGKSVEELGTVPENNLDDPLDKLGDPIADASLAESLENAYQSISYLPESAQITSTVPATKLIASVNASSGSKEITFPLGCLNNATDHDANSAPTGGRLTRGHFYDIVAKVVGGEVEFSWNVREWKVEPLAVELAGNTQLFVGASEITETVDGENPRKITYSTSAPFLSFESTEVEVGGKLVPLFEITENKDESTIEVAISSQVPAGTTISEDARASMGFWISAGSIRKFIKVKDVNLAEFVRISPEDRHLYISQIINATEYGLWYQYSTNMEGLTLTLSDYKNTNNKKGIDNLKVRIYTGSVADPQPWSKEAALTNGMTLSSLAANSADAGGFPKSGLICITVKDPAEQAAFGSEVSGKLTASAGSKSDAATFNIYPHADKLEVYFKDEDGIWDNPHVYVYQPLTYYNPTAKKEYYVFDKNGAINWLEYSFTGKIVFKGWKEEFGEVSAPTNLQSVTQGGATFDAYKAWSDDASSVGNFSTDRYFLDLDLIADYRKLVTEADADHVKCNDCREDKNLNRLWPGIAMIKEDNGWYRAVLPMLAEPGKAMIMFTNGHSNEGNNYTDNVTRYPGGSQPGIPMPNFAEGKAYFLFDKDNTSQLAFADFERTGYAPATPVEENTYYAIRGSIFSDDDNWEDRKMTLEEGKWRLLGVNCKEGSFGVKLCNEDGSEKEWLNSKISFMDGSHNNIGGLYIDKDGDNWKLGAGRYNFIFDPTAKTLRVEYADENILFAWPKPWKDLSNTDHDLSRLHIRDDFGNQPLYDSTYAYDSNNPGRVQKWYDDYWYYLWVPSSNFDKPLMGGGYYFQAFGATDSSSKETLLDSTKAEYVESTAGIPGDIQGKASGYYKIKYVNW